MHRWPKFWGHDRMTFWAWRKQREQKTCTQDQGKTVQQLRGTDILYTTRNYPIYYLAMTKCGCTFVKNLFYALDHGVEHPAGLQVHETEAGLVRATAEPLDRVQASPYAFTVLRDPMSRFLSFYFDKIYADSANNFPQIRQELTEEEGLDLSPNLSIEGHQANALKLADWVGRNLQGSTDQQVNFHWRPQSMRLRRAKQFELTHLTLDGLDWQLPILLKPVIPDLSERMAGITARNQAPHPVEKSAVITPDLVTEIARHFNRDQENYDAATARWAAEHPDTISAHYIANPPLPNHQRLISTQPEQTEVQLTIRGPEYCGAKRIERAMAQIGNVWEIDQPRIKEDDKELHLESFVLMRDPYERFLAIYFNEILPGTNAAFDHLRTKLARLGRFKDEAITPEQHLGNIDACSVFMAKRAAVFAAPTAQSSTRIQFDEVERGLSLGLKVCFYDQINTLLPTRCTSDAFVNSLEVAQCPDATPDNSADYFTPAIVARLGTLYRADIELYDRLRNEANLPPAGAWIGQVGNGET